MGSVTIQVPDATHERLKLLARAKRVSVNKLVEELTAAALADYDAEARFRARASRGAGTVKRGLRLLAKVGAGKKAGVPNFVEDAVRKAELRRQCRLANDADRRDGIGAVKRSRS